MAKSKRGGKAYVSGYARYKIANKEYTNRLNKLTKLAVKNPNNEQITTAIKNITHRRHVPKAPFWSPSMVRVASIIKKFTGKFNKDMFSNDHIIFKEAFKTRNENKFKQLNIVNPKGSMFSIGERVGWKF